MPRPSPHDLPQTYCLYTNGHHHERKVPLGSRNERGRRSMGSVDRLQRRAGRVKLFHNDVFESRGTPLGVGLEARSGLPF